MLQQLIVLTIALAVLGGAFWFVERRWPGGRQVAGQRTGRLTDIGFYFLNATVTKYATGVIIAVIIIAGGRLAGQQLDAGDVRAMLSRDTGLSRLPAPIQFAMLLVVADFIGYWSHRLFHFEPRLWRIHAVHHSSRQLDWLSAVRVHPLNDVVTSTVQALPLLLIGFNFAAFGGYVVVLTLYAIFLHSNVPWSYGRFRYAVASPVFHRWHHTTEREGIDKNFAGFFPLWDLAFGTFYMPEGRQPMEFGIAGAAPPEGFWRQLLYPLRPGVVLVENPAGL